MITVNSLTTVAGAAPAGLRLVSVFADHMVLQRDRPIPVWGLAAPGAAVEVKLGTLQACGRTDAAGRFRVELPALPAGGPYELRIGARVLHDVLVGDVWLCGGQSNMEFGLSGAQGAAADIAVAHHDTIRLFTVDKKASTQPQEDCSGTWEVCTPASAPKFSAVAYYFARDVSAALHVPIGLIQSAWGGSPAEAWTSLEGLSSSPALAALAERARRPNDTALLPHGDPGLASSAGDWMQPDLDCADWKTMRLPRSWQSDGLHFNGAVWFRREVHVPAAWCGGDLELSLGIADDHDRTWFNGVAVGATGPENAACYMHPRVYRVPAVLVRPGRNVISVRVFDVWGNGGMMGPVERMVLTSARGETLPLSGPWAYKVELALPQRSPEFGSLPTQLFNGMIHPLRQLKLRGAIWYQGENNLMRAFEYRTLFPTLIQDWRHAFGQPDLAFHFVQLANCGSRFPDPTGSAWAELREAQALTLRLPHTGMATAIDVGEVDIHPKNKRDVGQRLARTALRHVYGQQGIVAAGPTYRRMTVDGDTVRIEFDHANGGLVVRGDKLCGFAVAGGDKLFHWAQAHVTGDSVLVRSPSVPKPVAVRYAWADNPEVNLYNGAGLPAFPFRTDAWTLTTEG